MEEQVTTLAKTLSIMRDIRHKVQAGDNDAALQALADLEQPEIVRVFAIEVIDAPKITPEQLAVMGRHLLGDNSVPVQVALIKKLRDVPREDSVSLLLQVLLEGQNTELRAVAAQSVREARTLNWEEKVLRLLTMVSASGLFRETLDVSAVVIALSPVAESGQLPPDRFRLADALISHSVTCSNDSRLIGILAALIVESCGRNRYRAIQRINQYITGRHDSAEIDAVLLPLRVEVNSLQTSAELQVSLWEAYQEPLTRVQQEVRKKWHYSIVSAQVGIWSRILVSFFVTGGALWLLWMGGQRLFVQSQWPESFLSIGLGLVLLFLSFVFGNPIRETRQTMVEIGVASTIYAAYTQRSLKISNGYARLYLQNRLTTADIETSSALLGVAMQESVQALRGERLSLEDLLEQFS